jgi:two-component system, cell cycle sensor histidine kinase and response regulator CckA
MSKLSARPLETRSTRPSAGALAWKIAAWYALLAGLWISASGSVLYRLVRDAETAELLETAKGWVFVAVTALLLGAALQRYFRQLTQSAELLAQSQQRLQFALEASGHAVWDWDMVSNRVYYSDAWKSMLGFALHEIGSSLSDWEKLVHPEDLPKVMEAVDLHLQGQTACYVSEHRVRCRDGSYKWILDQGNVTNRGIDGKPLRFLGTHADITDRKRAEAALMASEERFRTLVENAPIGLFVQVDGRFAYVNDYAARTFGATTAQLHGRPVVERFHPEFRLQVKERIRLLNQRQEQVPLAEEKCLRLDGTTVEAEFSAVPFTYDGKSGALVFFNEVTERKRLEAQFRQAQKLEAVGRLAGGVAHDFNNILAVFMMHLGLLQMNSKLDRETRCGLRELEQGAQRAAGLTRQLLMFSRRSVLSMKPVEVNEVIGNLLKMLGRLIGEHIDLRFDAKNGLPQVEADPGMLEQVLMNLVVNARDAVPKGGRITIATALVALSAPKDLAQHPDRRAGRFVCLSVSDTGCGMDAATLKRVFEPFFTTKDVGHGTGLGLATVHGIAAQHKGWVEVQSQLGQGSTFCVYLPALDRGVDNPANSSQPAPLLRGKETILLVEDDPGLRLVAGQSLRELGYQVHAAANGRDAMRLWQLHAGDIALLLTDMVLPEGMTGVELAEQLQTAKPGLKVIITSGYSREFAESGAPTKTGLAYLPKPFETPILAHVVRQCLDTRN